MIDLAVTLLVGWSDFKWSEMTTIPLLTTSDEVTGIITCNLYDAEFQGATVSVSVSLLPEEQSVWTMSSVFCNKQVFPFDDLVDVATSFGSVDTRYYQAINSSNICAHITSLANENGSGIRKVVENVCINTTSSLTKTTSKLNSIDQCVVSSSSGDVMKIGKAWPSDTFNVDVACKDLGLVPIMEASFTNPLNYSLWCDRLSTSYKLRPDVVCATAKDMMIITDDLWSSKTFHGNDCRVMSQLQGLTFSLTIVLKESLWIGSELVCGDKLASLNSSSLQSIVERFNRGYGTFAKRLSRFRTIMDNDLSECVGLLPQLQSGLSFEKLCQ